jgi:hypothetical protein
VPALEVVVPRGQIVIGRDPLPRLAVIQVVNTSDQRQDDLDRWIGVRCDEVGHV